MLREDWPVAVGIALFALIAVACAVFMAASGQLHAGVTLGAILVLAAGQLALIVVSFARGHRMEAVLRRLDRNVGNLSDAMDAASGRIDLVEERAANPSQDLVDKLAADVRALRDGIEVLMPKPGAATPATDPVPPPQPAPDTAGSDRLELLLEPVIDLATGATIHYRALLGLADDRGNMVAHDELMTKADLGGMRADLDAHAVKLVAPVLRRLRLKNPGVRIFVPMGLATLVSQDGTARLTNALQRNSDVASGIVFEMAQDTLGALDRTGIGNLAALGRHGATMALANVFVAGLDLASLRQLGVRFLSIGASAFDAGFGMSPAWRDFSQYARAMQFQIIASGIQSTQQAAAATQLARFGHGPFFAPPRKVRQDAGVGPGQQRAQAA